MRPADPAAPGNGRWLAGVQPGRRGRHILLLLIIIIILTLIMIIETKTPIVYFDYRFYKF